MKRPSNKIVTERKYDSRFADSPLTMQIIRTPNLHYNARVLDGDKCLSLTPFRDTWDEANADAMAEINRILTAA